MANIIEFLEARIAEDEYEAEVCLAQYRRGEGGSSRRWVRQLAECAAKRSVVDHVAGWCHEYNDGDMWFSCGLAVGYLDDKPGSGCADESKHGRCTCDLVTRQGKILAPLAAVYKDHPDYQREWAQNG